MKLRMLLEVWLVSIACIHIRPYIIHTGTDISTSKQDFYLESDTPLAKNDRCEFCVPGFVYLLERERRRSSTKVVLPEQIMRIICVYIYIYTFFTYTCIYIYIHIQIQTFTHIWT